VALLFLDLDDFKGLNDRLGHPAGDAALREVAERLSGVVRSIDSVCRHGGDEFTVLLELARPEELSVIATRIEEAIRTPMTLAGREVSLPVSIGHTIADDSADAEGLIHAADRDMYRTKARKRAP
jgi:diguanylate cyclase (GGDEF)-like protein